MPPSPKEPESPAIEQDQSAGRARAVTASSYASTATPPKLEKDLGLSLGGDFAEMFAGFDKRKSAILDAENSRAMSQSPVSNHLLKHLTPRKNEFNKQLGNHAFWTCESIHAQSLQPTNSTQYRQTKRG
jgi:hypothetical protein